MIRVLPLTTDPVPGEAVDSWLHAIAVRHGVTIKDVYQHLELDSPSDLRTCISTTTLSDDMARRIGAATGVTPAQVHAMTLARYLPVVTPHAGPDASLVSVFPRHHCDGWRFCPHCLAASGGAWLLKWKLLWSFACTQHHCLLAERCPQCGRRQRAPQLLTQVPRPVHCAYPHPTTRGRLRPRCDADLATTPVIALSPDHPALRAQEILDDLLAAKQATFGLYAHDPTETPNVLGDIRLLGRGIVAATKGAHLDELGLPADLAALYRDQLHRNMTAGTTGSFTASVVHSAAAATAAVTLLDMSDLRRAAAPLAALTEDVSRFVLHQQERFGRPGGPTPSPVLQGLHYTALGDRLAPAQQLNYRLDSPFPHNHPTNPHRQRRLLHRLPAALWPDWALQLTPPTLGLSSARAALAAAVLLVGSDVDIATAAALLGVRLTREQGVYRLWRFKESPHWPAIREAVVVLADYLDTHDSPIDYQRRRRLDYSDLLTQTEWDTHCRRAGRQAHPAAHTRAYLQHRICGSQHRMGESAAPHAPRGNEVLSSFSRRLTPQLRHTLDDYALRFLQQHGIRDEPVIWAPPLSLIKHLTLPGESVTDVETKAVHRLIRDQRCSIPAASRQLGVTTNAVRAVLEHHPAPPTPRPAWQPRPGARRPGAAYQKAVQALPRDRLIDLYITQQRSLAGISADTGINARVIARLARDYDIALRRPGGRATPPVDRDWLYTEYVLEHRSCADLARELHISPVTVAALVEPFRSPMRTVCRRSEQQIKANPHVPSLLIPALIGHGGWERLQRFSVIAQFSTLAEAGQRLGITVPSTSGCVLRLERDFGARILERGPLRPTRFGDGVLAAVEKLAAFGGP